MKKLVKYQLKDCRNVFLIYFLIMIALYIWIGVEMLVSSSEEGRLGITADYSSILVFFITALSCFSETFNMWMQNHVSRKDVVKGLLLSSIIIGAINALFTGMLTLVFQGITAGNHNITVNSGLSASFVNYMQRVGVVPETVMNLLFVTIGVDAFMMAGYFIANIFYRAGKVVRRVIAIGLPVGFFVALPIIIATFAESAIITKALELIGFLSGAASGNPLYLIGTLTGVFILFGGLNYLLTVKLQVRGQ